MGEAAPPVRVCSGGLAEAARLIGECLHSEAGHDSDGEGGAASTCREREGGGRRMRREGLHEAESGFQGGVLHAVRRVGRRQKQQRM